MLKLLQRLAVLAAAACAPAVYAANATLTCAGTWSWNESTSTLTCNAVAPTNPVCTALTPSPTNPNPDTAFTLTAACSVTTGTIDTYNFAVGPSASRTNLGNQATNVYNAPGQSQASYQYWVRASKDGGVTFGDYLGATVQVGTPAVTAPNTCSISPTSATTGVARAFSVSCNNLLTGATYQWTSTGGSPSNGTNVSHTVTYSPAGNYTLTAQVCNAPNACATATQTVQVTDPISGGCTNLSGITTTMYFPPGGQVWDLQPGNVKWWTSEQGSFTGKHAALVAFRTPADASARIGSIAIAEIGSNPTNRLMLLSETRCATTSNYLIGAYGSTATVNFTVGTPVSGVTTLQPNTVYYVTITNRSRSGISYIDSCGTKDCSAIIELKL